MALRQTFRPQSTTDNAGSAWNLACRITYTRDTWVKLWQVPSAYAADEAKLLCQASDNAWVAWVPDHGEVVLDRSHFYG